MSFKADENLYNAFLCSLVDILEADYVTVSTLLSFKAEWR